MILEKIVVGNNYTNCYVIGEEKGTGAIIDPGAEPKKILKVVNELQLETITKIIITHGHFDHIAGIKYIKDQFDTSLLIHNQGQQALTDPEQNLSSFLSESEKVIGPKADRLLDNQDQVNIGSNEFEVVHTPGHSPDSICLYNSFQNILFSGDLLFKSGIGRIDFPGCSQISLVDSIEKVLSSFDETTTVYPGHGAKTTLEYFKKNVWENIQV